MNKIKNCQFKLPDCKIKTTDLTGGKKNNDNAKLLAYLFLTNQIKPNDKVTFGKLGMRVNHKPVKVESGRLVEMKSFHKSYEKKMTRKPSECRHPNEYFIQDNVAVFTTNQGDKSVQFKVDLEDIPIVVKNKWHAFNYMKCNARISNRKKVNGKWQTIYLEEALGYNINRKKLIKNQLVHINGDLFDFTRKNIKLI